jgi:predicted MFS family arabinose efflux permease
MNKQEWYTAGSLAAVYAVRMLGLFMILPVLPLYAKSLPDATPFMVGLAIGIYGLTQAIFQIPLGFLSDRIGRKPVIIGGLCVFALGSVIAAFSTSIEWITIGRAIQGMGAIAAATMALAADLTSERHRARVMSVIGLTIGISFSVAMIIGPIIDEWAGLRGVFWVTTVLAVIGILLVAFVVPQPQEEKSHRDAGIVKSYIWDVLVSASLWRMNIGAFFLHMIMTANFSVLPLIFEDGVGLDGADHWKIYLPVFLVAFLSAIPLIIVAEKHRKMRRLFMTAVGMLLVAQLGMAFLRAETILLLMFFLIFFIGFNFLEAVQPSLVAKYSNVNTKGTAMGVFSTLQFLGIFAGGFIGGLIQNHFGFTGVFIFGGFIAWLWVFVALTLPEPKFYTMRVVKLRPNYLFNAQETENALLAIPGIKEASVALHEGVAYLKVDKNILDDEIVGQFSDPNN